MPDSSLTFDPALVADEENAQLAQLLYTGLVRLDPHYKVVKDAAARIVISPNRRTYTFFLKKGLKFSNGDPLTAQDFKFSITRSLSPDLKSPSTATYLLDIVGARQVLAGKAKSVGGIKVVNPNELQITVQWAIPYFLMELTWPTSFALDKKAITKLGPPTNTAWYANPIGSGPYRVKSFTPNSQILLVKNKYYSGSTANVSKINISLNPLSGQGADLYQYVWHNLDVVSLPSYDASLLHQPGIEATKMLAIAGIYFNPKVKPFGNVHVRRALTLAISRASIVKATMGSSVTPFSGFVPPGQWGYDRQLKVRGYDPAQARKELAAAGYSKSKPFPANTLYYGVDPSNPSGVKLVERLAAALSKAWQTNLHISIDNSALTLNTLYTRAQSNSLPLYLSGWSADYPDPHDWLSEQWETKAPNNNAGYSNPKFDAAVQTADVSWAPGQRLQLYNTAQQILVDNAVSIPLYIPHRLVFIRPTVKNLILTGYGVIPKTGSWAQVRIVAAAAKAHGAF